MGEAWGSWKLRESTQGWERPGRLPGGGSTLLPQKEEPRSLETDLLSRSGRTLERAAERSPLSLPSQSPVCQLLSSKDGAEGGARLGSPRGLSLKKITLSGDPWTDAQLVRAGQAHSCQDLGVKAAGGRQGRRPASLS